MTTTIKTGAGETFADAIRRTLHADHVSVAVCGVSVYRADGYLAAELPKRFWPTFLGGEGLAIPAEIKLRFDPEGGRD